MSLFSFLYGIGAAFLALIMQAVLQDALPTLSLLEIPTRTAIATLIIFAALEECAIAIAVAGGLSLRAAPWRNILHAFLVGFGFVLVEVSMTATTYGTTFALTRASLGNTVIHLTTPLITMALLTWLVAWRAPVRVATAAMIATFLHASYNVLALVGYGVTVTPQFVFLCAIVIVACFCTVWHSILVRDAAADTTHIAI